MVFEPSRLVSYDREGMLVEIRRVVLQHFDGQSPSHKEFNRFSRVHSATIVNQFGSWKAAMQAAGIEYVRGSVKTADLLADLRAILQKAGGTYFTEEFYRRNGGRYSVKTLKVRFGQLGWAQLLERVLGVRPVRRVFVKPQRPTPQSRVQLLQELGRVWKEIGRRPTYGEFKSLSEIGIGAFEREFGSWKNAIAQLASQVGSIFPFFKGTHCTRELLLSELQSIAAKTSSNTFSYADYRAMGGSYSIGTFQNHFGRWRNAVSEIGLKDGHSQSRTASRKFSDEEFFAELQRVWEILGRQPKTREMKQHDSKMSSQAFQARFGSWLRAIHAFCQDRSSPDLNARLIEPITTSESANAESPSRSSTREQCERRPDGDVLVIQKSTPRQPAARLRFRVLERDRFSCKACGRSPANEPGVVLHVDHISPYRGLGETVFENLQTLCSRCNLGKSDLIPEF